jgi:hypothetical protein
MNNEAFIIVGNLRMVHNFDQQAKQDAFLQQASLFSGCYC